LKPPGTAALPLAPTVRLVLVESKVPSELEQLKSDRPSLRDWLDLRTGYWGFVRKNLDEPMPPGVGWWQTLGNLLMTLLVVSIIVCTLDRTPKLWRGVSDVRVAQPAPYFDPRLPDRAAMDGLTADGVRSVLRRSGFHVREATEAGGARFLYGDRHQYTKMATLLTHAGLVTFLVAAAVTSRLGDEQGLVVAVGESLTVQPIGTPGLLLVKNNDFEAPGFDTGHPTDFTTDLAVYQDGTQIARKTIRVNDPLSVGGYTFHQNGFGPAPHIVLRSAAGAILWDAPVPMTESADGLPYASIGIPGRDMGLKGTKTADG